MYKPKPYLPLFHIQLYHNHFHQHIYDDENLIDFHNKHSYYTLHNTFNTYLFFLSSFQAKKMIVYILYRILSVNSVIQYNYN